MREAEHRKAFSYTRSLAYSLCIALAFRAFPIHIFFIMKQSTQTICSMSSQLVMHLVRIEKKTSIETVSQIYLVPIENVLYTYQSLLSTIRIRHLESFT